VTLDVSLGEVISADSTEICRVPRGHLLAPPRLDCTDAAESSHFIGRERLDQREVRDVSRRARMIKRQPLVAREPLVDQVSNFLGQSLPLAAAKAFGSPSPSVKLGVANCAGHLDIGKERNERPELDLVMLKVARRSQEDRGEARIGCAKVGGLDYVSLIPTCPLADNAAHRD